MGYRISGFDDSTHDGLPSKKPVMASMKPVTPAQKKKIAAAMVTAKPLPATPATRIKAKQLPWKKGRITDYQQY